MVNLRLISRTPRRRTFVANESSLSRTRRFQGKMQFSRVSSSASRPTLLPSLLNAWAIAYAIQPPMEWPIR